MEAYRRTTYVCSCILLNFMFFFASTLMCIVFYHKFIKRYLYCISMLHKPELFVALDIILFYALLKLCFCCLIHSPFFVECNKNPGFFAFFFLYFQHLQQDIFQTTLKMIKRRNGKSGIK